MSELTEERLRHQLRAIADWTGPIEVPAIPTAEATIVPLEPVASGGRLARVLMVAAALVAILGAVVVSIGSDQPRTVDLPEAVAAVRHSAAGLAAETRVRVRVMSSGVPQWDGKSLMGAELNGSYDFVTRTGTLDDAHVPGATTFRVVRGELFVWVRAWVPNTPEVGSWVQVRPEDLASSSAAVRSVAARFLMRNPSTIVDLLRATSSLEERYVDPEARTTHFEVTLDLELLDGSARLLGELLRTEAGSGTPTIADVAVDEQGHLRFATLSFRSAVPGYQRLQTRDFVKVFFDEHGEATQAGASAPPSSRTVSDFLAERPFFGAETHPDDLPTD